MDGFIAATTELQFLAQGGLQQEPFSGMRPAFECQGGLVSCVVCFPQTAVLKIGHSLMGVVALDHRIDPDNLRFGREFRLNLASKIIAHGVVTGEAISIGRSYADIQALADLLESTKK